MKFYIKAAILILNSCCGIQYVTAFNGPVNTIICGRIGGGNKKDSVTLILKKEFIYYEIGVERKMILCDNDGNFSFRFPLSHIALVSVILNNNQSLLANEYLEAGDSIFCTVNNSPA